MIVMNTRDKILKAAKTLLYEEGFEAMSPSKVLKLSGAGQGSLYHHFSGKKELARTVLDDVAEELNEMAESIFDNENYLPTEKIELFLKRKRNGLLGCKLGRLANEKAFRSEDLRAPLEKYFSLVLTKIKRTLIEGVAQNLFKPEMPVDSIAHLIVASVQGGYVVSKSLNDDNAINQATQGALELLRAYKTEKQT